MRTAVITPVHGRHDHLRRQQGALADCRPKPDIRVVVAIDDPRAAVAAGPGAMIIERPGHPDGLPVAAARNAGAAAARAAGAELLIFLDVDCLPAPGTVAGYRRAAAAATDPVLLAGTVAYLPPPPSTGYDLARLGEHPPHPARPAPTDADLPGTDHRLFWSLSFAVTAATWDRIGGFDERYHGYGAEDTDFALRAAASGVGLTWVHDAPAYHQWHPTTTPPRQHLDDILRNGARFAATWGWWPMGGWLEQFAELGLVRRHEGDWVRA